MGDIVSSLGKQLGLRTYDSDRAANLNIGAQPFNIISNRYGTVDPATNSGLNGTVVHEAYLTTDGKAYFEASHMGITDGTSYSPSDVQITMLSGAFATNTWVNIEVGILNEKAWITAWNPSSGVLTFGSSSFPTRGQLGTTPITIKPGSKIWTVGDSLNESVYSKPFYSSVGYWSAIKCISSSNTTGSVRMQANNLDGDNIAINKDQYEPMATVSPDYYIDMSPGDIYYGKFNRVCVDEAPVAGTDNGAKLILYKG